MNGEALELPDDTLDVSASLNGLSLFPDSTDGLKEIVRVTNPGGRVMIVTSGAPRNAGFLNLLMGALKASVPGITPLPMDPPPLPFQLADPSRFHPELAGADLTDVRVGAATWETTFASAARFRDVISAGHPIVGRLTSPLTGEQRTDVKLFRKRSPGAPNAVISAEMNIDIGPRERQPCKGERSP